MVAAVTGRHRTRVYRWTYPKDRGGTDGQIPRGAARRLLDWARANRKPLTADHFFAAPSTGAPR